MVEKKRYVVWSGRKIGIFEDWEQVHALVSGYSGAKFKGFKSKKAAEVALEKGADEYYQPTKKRDERDIDIEKKSIAVDAAYSSSTGVMEYRGIDLSLKKEVFLFSFPEGTNNIGEFLAIVHGLSRLKSSEKEDFCIYSDSKIAIAWVREKKCKSNYLPKDEKLTEIIKKAEQWLRENEYAIRIIKRDTENRGEIPADFGRK